jgi:hypothetical protein
MKVFPGHRARFNTMLDMLNCLITVDFKENNINNSNSQINQTNYSNYNNTKKRIESPDITIIIKYDYHDTTTTMLFKMLIKLIFEMIII